MWYAIGAIVLFNLLVFAFIYGAGKANKAYDKSMDEYFGDPEPYGPGDIVEQGRSMIKKNQQAFGPLVYPVRFVKSLIRKRHGHL